MAEEYPTPPLRSGKRKVALGDTVKFHFRLAALDGTDFDSTFEDEPVILKLGSGDLYVNLEKCLVGLGVHERFVFQLEPWQAFGENDPALVQRLDLADLPSEAPIQVGSLVEFSLPNGTTMAGTIKERTPTDALVDFNHPLSGCPLLFEVEVLEILD